MNANPPRLLVCVLLAGLAGCGPAPAPAPTPSPPAVTASFSGTDRPWLEINIAMAEELLPLLDLAPDRAGDPALRELSAQVRAFTEEELATLRTLHGEAGLPSANPHKGMPMPGMVTPSQVAEATALRGDRFDDLLRRCLTEHLRQGRQLATSEQAAGAEPRAVALAGRILETRSSALKKLEE